EICQALITRKGAPAWEQMQAVLGARRLALRGIGMAPLSSQLPVMATAYGDDLTDTKGEAPILRKIKEYDTDMVDDPRHGYINHTEIETNVGVVVPVEKKDTFE